MPTMLVEVYSPSGGYGFCVGEGTPRVYFAADAFTRTAADEPPPVLGERVDVRDVRPSTDPKKAAKAKQVIRLTPPTKVAGQVQSFDHRAGWGFVAGADDKQYFLHRSDMVQPWLPLVGDRVVFFAGYKGERPRACYVRPAA